MIILTLKRIALLNHSTFGVLFNEDKIPFALTVERPWLNNKVGESCIPLGDMYVCNRVVSPKFGLTYEVIVEGRSKILFHKGNISDDSHGCIILGEQFEFINGKPGVLASKKGFKEFMDILKNENQFRLVIVEV